MRKYSEIPDNSHLVMTYPTHTAMIFGISQIGQNNKGEITVIGSNGQKWELGDIGVDIRDYTDTENALLDKIMPLCE